MDSVESIRFDLIPSQSIHTYSILVVVLVVAAMAAMAHEAHILRTFIGYNWHGGGCNVVAVEKERCGVSVEFLFYGIPFLYFSSLA